MPAWVAATASARFEGLYDFGDRVTVQGRSYGSMGATPNAGRSRDTTRYTCFGGCTITGGPQLIGPNIVGKNREICRFLCTVSPINYGSP